MSYYYRDYYRNGDCGCHEDVCCEKKKESSATAKTALGLAIGGLGLAAVNGGLFGGGECGGGLLGGLFGGNRGNCEQLARGRQAQTELAVIQQYLMPTWNELCELKRDVAVNKAIESKNNEITHLLFKRAEEQTAAGFELNKLRTDSAFALAHQELTCCCDKNNTKIDYVSALNSQRTDSAFALARQEQQCCCDKTNDRIGFVSALERQRTEAAFALADQRQQCYCDRLDTKINCVDDRLSTAMTCNDERINTKVDSAFVVNNLITDKKIGEATKNMVQGNVYLSPASLADPYAAGTNVLLSRHINRCCGSTATFSDCGCNGWGTGFNW